MERVSKKSLSLFESIRRRARKLQIESGPEFRRRRIQQDRVAAANRQLRRKTVEFGGSSDHKFHAAPRRNCFERQPGRRAARRSHSARIARHAIQSGGEQSVQEIRQCRLVFRNLRALTAFGQSTEGELWLRHSRSRHKGANREYRSNFRGQLYSKRKSRDSRGLGRKGKGNKGWAIHPGADGNRFRRWKSNESHR